MVEAVRASSGYVPELAFVAEDQGEVVGRTMLSYVGLAGTDRQLLELAPLAVEPERQREGIGSTLTRASLAAAESAASRSSSCSATPATTCGSAFAGRTSSGSSPRNPPGTRHSWSAPLAAYDPSIRGRVVFPLSFGHAG